MGYFVSSFELKVKHKGLFINILNFTFLLQLLKTQIAASVTVLVSFSRQLNYIYIYIYINKYKYIYIYIYI